VALTSIDLGFDGGGTREEASRAIPEREKSYPESTMFGDLPAYGLYCRHVRGLAFRKLKLRTGAADLRHAMAFDDAQDVTIDGLDAQFSPGAAAVLRMTQVRRATLRNCSPQKPVDTLLRLEGDQTSGVVLEQSDVSKARRVVDRSAEVAGDALSQR
jgi:hypothetical protein